MNFWGVFDDEAVFAPIIAAYQKQQPNVTIVYTRKDASLYEFASLNLLAEQGGPDVWLIPLEWLPKHQDKLTPIPEGFLARQNLPPVKKQLFRKAQSTPTNAELFPKLFAPVTSASNITAGKLYSLPLSVDTLGLFANTAILQAEGVTRLPVTWDEVVEVVKKITQRSGLTITKPAIALGTSGNVARSADILATLMIQNHTPMVNEQKNEARFNQAIAKATGEAINPGIAALDFYTSFASPTKETFTWTPIAPADFELFASGGLPMMIDYSFRIRDLTAKNATLPFATAPLPQIRDTDKPATLATALVVGVPSVSQRQTQAWQFVSFLTNRQNSLTYARATGRPPARLELAADPGFDPRLAPFTSQIPIAVSWYRNEITKTTQVFHQGIDATLAGQPIADVIDRLTKQVTHILRGEAYE